jgi:catechol 2,3-dioxygenase-like lactoylglutathione lyase family enzyme
MKLNLAVVTLWAEDVNRTADFYREVLGCLF